MYVIRDVIRTKPGKAKELIEKFKSTIPFFDSTPIWGARLLTDTVAGYWTVIFEAEVEELEDYFRSNAERRADPRWAEAMKGYMDLVDSGHREIFEVEAAWTKSEIVVGSDS